MLKSNGKNVRDNKGEYVGHKLKRSEAKILGIINFHVGKVKTVKEFKMN